MDYNKIIILLIAIVLIILVVGGLFVMNPFKEESKIIVITNDTVHVGSCFLVELTDLDNHPISGENLTITLRDNNNSRLVVNEQLTTNNGGDVILEINNISSGNYTVLITFDGNSKYKECNLTYNLRIIDDAIEVLSTDPDSPDVDNGAFYSEQAGRTIYTDEVQLGPDGHYWKHLGNNNWVQID